MPDFYPRNLAARVPWHANFAVQATATGVTHGLTALQVSQIGIDSTNVAAIVNYLTQADAFGQAVTEFKDLMLEGDLGIALPPVPTVPAAFTLVLGSQASIEARTRQYAALVRASVGYTQQIGEQYGIVAAAPAPAGTPTVEAFALTQSQVRLVIFKAGYDVLAVDSRVNSGAWEQIGISQTAEFIDSRGPVTPGMPETREFRVQGMVANARTGVLSAVSRAITAP